MGKFKGLSRKSEIVVLGVLGICLCYFSTPVCSYKYGGAKSAVGKTLDNVNIDEVESGEEHCQRLPPKYFNASGSLQFAHFDLLSLLQHGTDLIDRTKYDDKATLILGNTGSGKTTISQILSGKLNSLHAVLTQSDRLVIIDDNFKISGPSTTSKTLIPELVVMNEKEDDTADNENATSLITKPGTIFYDCPGFDDSRGPEEDLAASFFMNHIVRRKVNQVKMLFLVIHSSVKMGNDRLDFDLLASHATKFVRNLEKYRNSIGLVVTKVNSFNARGRYITDKIIQREIVEFLQVYTENMQLKLSNPKITSEEREVTENKIKFTEILLQRNKNGEYFKITFSRDPEKCGPLSESNAVAQNRNRILSLTKHHLAFTPANDSDFGYTLKASTTLSMHRVSQNVNREIASSISEIIARFENWMETVKFSRTSSNLTETLNIVENTLLQLSKLVETLHSYSSSSLTSDNATTAAAINVVGISKLFTRTLRKIGYHVSSKVEYFMARQQAYIEFFEADDTTKILDTWINSVKKLRDEYQDFLTWCKFCQNVEKEVAYYSFQKDIRDNNQILEKRNASSWLSVLEKEAKMPVSAKLKQIADSFNGSKGEHFKNRFIEIMEFASKKNEVQCKGTVVYVLGNFVRVSEFAEELNEDRLCCSSSTWIKRVEVYASHTIFIDADISAVGRELNLVFVAPNWHVIGQRAFNLQGSNASAIYPEKAKSGRDDFGEDGENGEPGKPGGPGGSMFGIAKKVTRDTVLDILHVNVNGGDGGRGQDGGDGGNGLDGRSTAYGSNYEETRDLNILWLYVKDRVEYDGYSGTPGGNGGYGGLGGNGGHPGRFAVNILEKSAERRSGSIINKSRRKGEKGEDGTPGEAGQGGKAGSGMTCYKSRILVYTSRSCESTSARASRGDSGFSFWDIFNTDGADSAKWPEYSVVEWQSLVKFKQNFYQENVEVTQQFLQMIDNGTDIMGDVQQRVQFFVGEFYLLQQQQSSSKLSEEALLSMYTDFIKNVEAFAERESFLIRVQSGNRKTINLLLAAAYTKVVSLKQGEKSLGLVLDIQGYLNRVKTQLQEYSFKNLSTVLSTVERKFEVYLYKKTGNLNEFVEQMVTPSIVNARKDQHQRLAALERRFMEILNSTEGNGISWENVKWQLRKDQDVQEVLQLQQVNQVIPLIASTMNFLASDDALIFLTSRDPRNTSLITRPHPQLQAVLAYSISRNNASEVAETYLSEQFAEKLANDFQDKKDQVEELMTFVKLSALDAHEMKMSVQESVLSFASLITKHLSRQSQQWRVNMHIQKVKETLAALAEGVDSQVFINMLDRIQLALTLITDLHDNIDQYQNIKLLVSHWENYEGQQTGRSRTSVESQLEHVIGQNVLKREYEKALHAFRQWAFPFAKLYKSKIAPTGYTFEQTQNYYEKQVEMLEAEAMGRNETTSRIYQSGALHRGDFYAEPFFVWENSAWGKEIKNLLAGEKVTLSADIRKAPGQRNAVKCHLVELRFKVNGGNDEEELNTLLGNFTGTLSHSGVSLFKYNNQFFVMTGKNQYSIVQYNHYAGNSSMGNRISNDNEVYFQTSPYTLWTMQLEPKENGAGMGLFEDLQKWANVVDLELVGTGVYVENGYRLEVERYYEKDDSLALDENFQVGGNSNDTWSRDTEKYIELEEEDEDNAIAEDYNLDLTPVQQ